jgi:toxin ParE1/3/4
MTPASREDVGQAARWYESQKPGLGREFIAQVRETFAAVMSHPLPFPEARRQMRRAQLHRFPYGVFFFTESESKIVVLAVIDLRRNPRTWESRA